MLNCTKTRKMKGKKVETTCYFGKTAYYLKPLQCWSGNDLKKQDLFCIGFKTLVETVPQRQDKNEKEKKFVLSACIVIRY